MNQNYSSKIDAHHKKDDDDDLEEVSLTATSNINIDQQIPVPEKFENQSNEFDIT